LKHRLADVGWHYLYHVFYRILKEYRSTLLSLLSKTKRSVFLVVFVFGHFEEMKGKYLVPWCHLVAIFIHVHMTLNFQPRFLFQGFVQTQTSASLLAIFTSNSSCLKLTTVIHKLLPPWLC
jgi:hypothetical protein